MNKTSFKNFNIRLLLCCGFLIFTAIIIHSCKKERFSASLTDTVLANARTWYESSYPTVNLISSLNTQSIYSSGNSIDFSKILKPNWNNASVYKRLGKNIVELPIDASTKIGSDLRAGNFTLYNQSNSRISFLLLNDGGNFQAYLMVIIADSTYIKNDRSKLANNTYRHIDTDFSGWLYYTTPKGILLSGWKYRNGHIVNQLSINTSPTNSPLKIQETKTNTIQCTDWWADYYFGDILAFSQYLGQTCVDDGIDATRDPDPTDGGPPAPGSSPSQQPSIITLPFKLTFCNTLTSTQQIAIANQLNAFATEDCPSKFLANYFIGQTLSFCVNSSTTGNAGYNAATDAFTYSNDSMTDIDVANLMRHEFFHDYQNHFYSGGIASYETAPYSGYANIEFEQAVFSDIVTGQYQAFSHGTQNQLQQYTTWIDALRSNGTAYPKFTDPTSPDYAQFITSYNSFLSQWNGIPGNVYSSPLINLAPTALINLFNNTNPNCP